MDTTNGRLGCNPLMDGDPNGHLMFMETDHAATSPRSARFL